MNTGSNLRFCFELDALEDIQPWGEAEKHTLHWFGLTSGRYWMSTPLGEALRYTEERESLWNLTSPYVDYQIARWFEDLQCVLPFAMEPVPSDIANMVTYCERDERLIPWLEAGRQSNGKLDVWSGASQWWNDRNIDTAYLVNGPEFHFWRIGDQVFIRWEQKTDEKDVWELPNGQFATDAAVFQAAINGFLDEVISRMKQRVDTIRTKGWRRTDCSLDIEGLVREQEQRTGWVREVKERQAKTDWASTRGFLGRLQSGLRQT
jgi:hypothetical protein